MKRISGDSTGVSPVPTSGFSHPPANSRMTNSASAKAIRSPRVHTALDPASSRGRAPLYGPREAVAAASIGMEVNTRSKATRRIPS